MPKLELTSEIIGDLKQIFPKLFRVKQADQDFVIRPMTRAEWMFIQSMAMSNPKFSQNDLDDKVVEYGLVWPNWNPMIDFASLPAGIIPNLSLHIQSRSGFRTGLPIEVEEEYETVQDNPVVWDAPSDKDIADLKVANKLPMSKVTADKQIFIVRGIRRPEWTELNKRQGTKDDTEMALIEKALLFPSKDMLGAILPGTVHVLSEQILQLSGFTEEPTESEEL